MTDTPHKNDMYGNIEARNEGDDGVLPTIPAATVVLVKDVVRDNGSAGIEVLMLRKNSKITFGGMWVFPGGKIDPEDYPADGDLHIAARHAAARETVEEAGIELAVDEFVQFAHWTPPPGPQKRFATWFFVALTDGEYDVAIDEGEIEDHRWISPQQALKLHASGEIDLVPPTWVTLYHLSLYKPAKTVIEHFANNEPKVYATRVVKSATGDRVAMWHGDSGYEPWDADVAGERHRLVMSADGFRFENSIETY